MSAQGWIVVPGGGRVRHIPKPNLGVTVSRCGLVRGAHGREVSPDAHADMPVCKSCLAEDARELVREAELLASAERRRGEAIDLLQCRADRTIGSSYYVEAPIGTMGGMGPMRDEAHRVNMAVCDWLTEDEQVELRALSASVFLCAARMLEAAQARGPRGRP